jgi:hypothetical protein
MDETQNLPRRARDDRVVRAPSRPAGTSREPRPVGSDIPSRVLSDSERDRLARLLALVPPPNRWAFEHRHAPLLCALGVLDPPDEGYAHAARRRFADPAQTRDRTLALLIDLQRETRAAPKRVPSPARPRPLEITRPRRPVARPGWAAALRRAVLIRSVGDVRRRGEGPDQAAS